MGSEESDVSDVSCGECGDKSLLSVMCLEICVLCVLQRSSHGGGRRNHKGTHFLGGTRPGWGGEPRRRAPTQRDNKENKGNFLSAC